MTAYLVQRAKSIKFHDGEVVPEEDECWYIDDVLWTLPEVW